MIYIYQNQVNNVLTRFFDRRLRTDTFFLWEITNDITNNVTLFITKDISDVECSYNLFKLEHSHNGSETGGVDVPLNLEPGHNNYTVYETTEFSIDKDNIIGIIEEDIMFVELIRGANTDSSELNNIYY